MSSRTGKEPVRVRLSDEKRRRLMSDVQAMFAEEFDRELSDFQSERLLDYFLQRIGAPIYNQAIEEARDFMALKLDDLEGELYEPED